MTTVTRITTLAGTMHRNHDGGLSVIPIDHTTKRPAAKHLPLTLDLNTGEKKPSWKPYQDRLPTHEEIDQWCNAGIKAYALVCGKVSGDLEIIDFDVPGFYELWLEQVGDLVDQYNLPRQRTHSGNHQVAYRSPNRKGNQKLAWAKNDAEPSGREIAIETRGEAGYALWAPSLGPSGKHYEAIAGDIADTPVIPEAVADVLLQAARRLCEMPYTRQELVTLARQKETGQRQKTSADTGDDVIATHNDTRNVRDELRRIGQTDGPRGRMSRPGQPGSAGTVVLDAENVCFPWSSNDPLHRTNGDGKPLPIDPFDIFVHYDHNGDYQAAYIAAKKLQGKWREPPAKTLVDPETGEIFTFSDIPTIRFGENGHVDATPLPGAEVREDDPPPGDSPPAAESEPTNPPPPRRRTGIRCTRYPEPRHKAG